MCTCADEAAAGVTGAMSCSTMCPLLFIELEITSMIHPYKQSTCKLV